MLLAAATAWAQQPAVRILIAYHSDTGHTEKLAQSVRDGAASVSGVAVLLRRTADVTDAELLGADGIVLGTPVHWSTLSTEAKRTLDRIANVHWQAKRNGDGRTAGTFCTGGAVASGKDSARLAVLSSFLSMRFIIVGGVDAEGYGTPGPQATTGPADPGISAAEQKEAAEFGRRFAEVTRKLRTGR
jgi:NAD(P)H dehydrogenase (quinone)